MPITKAMNAPNADKFRWFQERSTFFVEFTAPAVRAAPQSYNKRLIPLPYSWRLRAGIAGHHDLGQAGSGGQRPDQCVAPPVHLLTTVGSTSRYGPMKKASPVPSPK